MKLLKKLEARLTGETGGMRTSERRGLWLGNLGDVLRVNSCWVLWGGYVFALSIRLGVSLVK